MVVKTRGTAHESQHPHFSVMTDNVHNQNWLDRFLIVVQGDLEGKHTINDQWNETIREERMRIHLILIHKHINMFHYIKNTFNTYMYVINVH